MNESVTFNGVEISDFYQVASVTRPLTGRANTFTEIGGMNGARLTGSVMQQATIGVRLVMCDMDSTGRREAARRLSSMIHTDEPSRLYIGSDNGRYYMAILDGEVPFTEHVRSGLVELNFVTETPLLYGRERSVSVPSQGEAGFLVGGTYATRPVVEGTVTGDGSSGLWGVRLDDGDVMRIRAGSGVTVSMDCDSRTATVSGELRLPTLGSDWLELAPGRHVLRNDVGSGACTVRWREMWI